MVYFTTIKKNRGKKYKDGSQKGILRGSKTCEKFFFFPTHLITNDENEVLVS